ncbi:hypothetical protein L596_006295 [Steinernema carpocapsae]|uniref:Sodium channel protein Nach n=1 Tax=Steinernema carpocapsae TaxID=34508 RepID=A0A4U8V1M4_STECR|nr:hypothetical protein L596_006295 [Steinernema carpocapsae]
MQNQSCDTKNLHCKSQKYTVKRNFPLPTSSSPTSTHSSCRKSQCSKNPPEHWSNKPSWDTPESFSISATSAESVFALELLTRPVRTTPARVSQFTVICLLCYVHFVERNILHLQEERFSSLSEHYFHRPAVQIKDTSDFEEKPKCSCRFRWAYELHGLTQFLHSKTLAERILWAIVIVFCVIGAVTNFYLVFSEYLSRQTATLMTIKQQRRLPFPGITFCPKNVDALDLAGISKDIQYTLGNVSKTTSSRLLSLMLTGAGFNSMNGMQKHESYLRSEDKSLRKAYKKWKGRRSTEEMFEIIFAENGYRCENFFEVCYYGSRQFNCCDWFEPVYVMLRGRCFRMKKKYQVDDDEEGKLSFTIKRLKSPYGDPTGEQPQLVVYIANHNDEIAMFHRYYLSLNEWNRMRFRLRETKMLPGKEGCSQRPYGVGRSTCFFDSWHKKIRDHFKCTLFYAQKKPEGMPVCDPFVIAKNYQLLVNYSIEPIPCLPSCTRLDYTVDVFTSELATTVAADRTRFHLEASYTDLQRRQDVVGRSSDPFPSWRVWRRY